MSYEESIEFKCKKRLSILINWVPVKNYSLYNSPYRITHQETEDLESDTKQTVLNEQLAISGLKDAVNMINSRKYNKNSTSNILTVDFYLEEL